MIKVYVRRPLRGIHSIRKMKKLLLIGCLLFFVGIINSQSLIIRADYMKQHFYNEKLQDFPAEWNPKEECHDTIVINLKDSLVTISNARGDFFNLIELTKNGNGVDTRDGDIYSSLQFIAYDKDGIMVTLAAQFFRSKTLVLTIRYGNVELRYQGRPPSFKNSSGIVTI